MATVEQENFLRLAIVIVDHAKNSFIELLELHLSITKQTLEQFINLYRHEIFHLFDSRRCCRCPRGNNPQRRTRVIQTSQMTILFGTSSCGKREFCCCVAKPGVNTRVLDMTLAKCLLINFCSDVFWYSCLDYAGLTFEQYLQNTKHDVYHLWQHSSSCCECDPSTQMPSRPFLDTPQWNQMYSSTSTPCINHRKRPLSGSVTCICSMTAKSGIALPIVNESVKEVLLKQFCSVRLAIDFLATTRNERYGHVSEGQISNAQYQTLINEVEKSIIEIAKVCKKENEFRSKLELAKTRTLDANLHKCFHEKMLYIMTQHQAIDECQSGISAIKGKLSDKTKLISSVPGNIAAKIPRLMEESTKPISDAVQEGTFHQLELVEKYGNKLRRQSEQTRLVIEKHKRLRYVENDAVRQCMEWIMGEGDVVILYGRTGSGKSSAGLEILRQIKEKDPDYYTVRVTDISQINEILNEGVKIAVLMDDIYCECACGMNKTWNAVLYQLSMCKESVALKLILTIESKLMKTFSERFHSKFFDNVFEMNLESKVYSLKEKRVLLSVFCARFNISLSQKGLGDQASRYLDKKTFDEIVKLEPYEPLPLAYKSFTSNTENFKLGIDHFKQPSMILVRSVVKFKDASEKYNLLNRIKYLILFFIFKEGSLTIKKENDLRNLKDMLSYGCTLTEFKALVKEAVQGIEDDYIISNGDQFQFVHRLVYEAVAIAHYDDDHKSVIMSADLAFLFNKVQLKAGKNLSVKGKIYLEPNSYGCFKQRVKTIFLSDYQTQVECFVESLCSSLVIRQDNTNFYRPFLKIMSTDVATKCPYYLPIVILYFLVKIGGVPDSIRCTVETIKCDIHKSLLVQQFCFSGFKHIVKYICENGVDEQVVGLICKTLIDVNVEIDLTPFVVAAIERGYMSVGGIFLTCAASLVTFVRLIDDLDDTYLPHLIALMSSRLLKDPCSRDKTIVLQWLISQADALSLNTQKEAEAAFQHQFPELAMWIIDTFPTKVSNIRALIEIAAGSGWAKHAITMIKTNDLRTYDMCHISNSVCSASIQRHLLEVNAVMSILPMGVSVEERVKKLEEFLPQFVNITEDINKHMLIKEIFKTVGTNVMQSFTSRLFLRFIIATTNWEKGHQINYLFSNVDLPLSDLKEVQNINMKYPWSNKQQDLLMWLLKHYRLTGIDWNIILKYALIIDKENDEGLSIKQDNTERDRTQGKTLISIQLVKSVGLEAFNFQHCLMESCRNVQTDFIKFLCNECSMKEVGEIVWTDVIDTLPKCFDDDKTKERTAELVRCLAMFKYFPINVCLKTLFHANHFQGVKSFLEELGHARLDGYSIATYIYDYCRCKHGVDRKSKNAEHEVIYLLANFQGELFNAKDVMMGACTFGHLEVVKILLEKVDHASLDIAEAVNELMCCCFCSCDDIERRNKEHLMIYLLTNVQSDSIDNKDVMRTACALRFLEVVRILIEKVDHASLDIAGAVNALYDDVDDDDFDDYNHKYEIRRNKEHLMIYLLTNIQIDLFATKEVMRNACQYGHLEVVKILIEKVDHESLDIAGAVNALYGHDYGDYYAHKNKIRNKEHLMIYLLTNIQIDLFATKEVMRNACQYGHRKVVKILIEKVDHGSLDIAGAVNALYGDDDDDDDDDYYNHKNEIGRNKEHLMIYLLTNVQIDLFATKEVMRNACKYGHLKVVKILIEKVDHGTLDINGAVNEMYSYTRMFMIYGRNDELRGNIVQLMIYLLKNVQSYLIHTKQVMRKACVFGHLEVVKILTKKVDHAFLGLKETVNVLLCEPQNQEDDTITYILVYLLSNVNIAFFDMQTIIRYSNAIWKDVRKVREDNDDLAEPMNDIVVKACSLEYTSFVMWIITYYVKNQVQPQQVYNEYNEVFRSCSVELVSVLLREINDIDVVKATKKACVGDNISVVLYMFATYPPGTFNLDKCFITACSHGSKDVAEWLITLEISVSVQEEGLIKACRYGRTNIVQYLIERLTFTKECIQDAIITAIKNEDCSENKTDAICHMLSVKYRDRINFYYLMTEACKCCRFDIIEYFVKEISSADLKNAFDCILMMRPGPSDRRNFDCRIQSLLNDILRKMRFETLDLENVILKSCSKGYVDLLKSLQTFCKERKEPFPVNTALKTASVHGQRPAIDWLLRSFPHDSMDLKSLIVDACGYGWVQLLKDHKYVFFSCLSDCITEACSFGRKEIVDLIIELDLNISEDDMNVILKTSCEYGWEDIFGWVIQNENYSLFDIEKCISEACLKGNTSLVKQLYNLYGSDRFDINLIYESILESKTNGTVLEFLLSNFGFLNLDPLNVLSKACNFGWPSVVSIIIDRIDDFPGLDLYTAFLEACDNGENDIVLIILKRYPSVNLDVKRAMVISCEKGWDEIVHVLLDKIEHERLDVGECLLKSCEAGEAETVDVIFKHTDVNSLDLTSCLEKAMDNPLNEQTVLVILKQLGMSMRKYDVERVKHAALEYSWNLVLSYLLTNKVP